MILNDVTQRRLEKYEALLLEKGEEVRSAAAFNRIIVEAALESGIADSVPEDLLDMAPRDVRALTVRVRDLITAAREPLTGE